MHAIRSRLTAAEWTVAVLLTLVVLLLHYVNATSAGGLWRDEANTVGLATLPRLRDVIQNLQYDSFPMLWPLIVRVVATTSGYMNDDAFRVLGLCVGCGIVGGLASTPRGLRQWTVDVALHRRMKITAVDISPSALRVYQRHNPAAFEVRHADILDLPFDASSFDGIYNLGVLEHFNRAEIHSILAQFHRVLKPSGKLVIFWSHARATSVAVLKAVHWVLNDVTKSQTSLHPPEVSLLRGRQWVEPILREADLQLVDYSLGPRDFFVQAIVLAERLEPAQAEALRAS